VIGSGIAGLNFARNASRKGKVLIVTKKKAASSSTNKAQGGIAAVLKGTDDFDKHIEDTMKAGHFKNDRKAVEFMVKKGPEAIEKLLEIGVRLNTSQGELSLAREGGHSARRIAHAGDFTGKEIERALLKDIRNNPNITLMEHTFALDLLVKDEVVFGATIISPSAFLDRKRRVPGRRSRKKSKQIVNVLAKATIIATGGVGQLYKYTTNPEISTGDGIAMAYRAGAKLKDMQYVQFHPTALNIPGKKPFLLSEALRGEGAVLINHKDKQFVEELKPRDIVAKAIFQEMQDGPVYLQFKNPKIDLKARFPVIYKTLKSYNLDLTKDRIPITPAAHYICGGIQVNLKGETSLKSLYAFGEAACTGVHGTNRLASNSLLEAFVFSDQVLKNLPTKSIPDYSEPALLSWTPIQDPSESQQYKSPTPQGKRKLSSLKSKLKNLMWENCGVNRRDDLDELKNELETMKGLVNKNQTNESLKVLENMIHCAWNIALLN